MTSLRIKLSHPGGASRKWTNWGLTRAPFPESGVATKVGYEGHLVDGQVATMSDWLTYSLAPDTTQWKPLAMKGDIGVGKTHWLRQLETVVYDYGTDAGIGERVLVTSQVLTAAGMRSLTLGGLLDEGIAGTDLIDRVVASVRGRDPRVPRASPLAPVLRRIADADVSEAGDLTVLLRGWLGRRRLSPTKLERLGASGRLEAEGQWVRAQVHFIQVARSLDLLSVWFVLIDQLEDLWRRDVTTPLRRARFLTDLRLLIDEAFEGAPIAVAMAWNTGGGPSLPGPRDVEQQLHRDYHALFTRIFERVVEIPPLPRAHALPFAMAYVKAAQSTAEPPIASRLEAEVEGLLVEMPPGDLSPRTWLARLSAWADSLDSSP